MYEPTMTSDCRLRRDITRVVLVPLVVALVVAFFGPQGNAKKLRLVVKKEPVSVRLVGRTAPLPVSSFSANYDSYVAVLQTGKNKDGSFVKLVYRFLNYDRSLPAIFMDYGFVHKFRAIRQPECDEAADSMLYAQRLASTGEVLEREFSFEYAKNADISIPRDVLPCYVVSPDDYKGSDRIRDNPVEPAAVEKEAAASRGSHVQ